MSADATDTADGPIFIVGTPRSGTTLLAAMVGSHPAIACGPETGLFRNFEGGRRPILRDPHWPDEAVRFVTELVRPGVEGTIIEHFGLDAATVRAELAGRPRSPRSLLESITVPWMRQQGKRRWAEKSPGHLLHVREIRRLWPAATILVIVRDPRAVASSLMKVPFGAETAVGAAYRWRLDQDFIRGFVEADPRAMLIRFEDLTADAEPIVRRICALVGEPFEPAMLTPGDTSAAVVVQGEWYKDNVRRAVDPNRASAWRTELSVADQELVAMVCAEGMARHGYEGGIPALGRVAVHPLVRNTVRAEEVLVQLAARRLVADPLEDTDPPRRQRMLVIGRPGQLRWTQGGGSGVRRVARWAGRLTRARARRRPVLWVEADLGRQSIRTPLERIGDLALRLLARRVPAERIGDHLG